MIHLTIQQLSSFLDGDITEANADLAREHFAACETCKSKLDQLGNMDAALAVALSCDPDDAFFERFSAKLSERLISEEAKEQRRKAESTAAAAPAPKARPARLAPAYLDAMEPAAPHGRIAREPSHDRELDAPPRKPPRQAPSPAMVSLTIVAIAGTVGALIFGKELASYVLYGPRPAEIHADSSAGGSVPGQFAAQVGAPAAALPGTAASPSAAKTDEPDAESPDDPWHTDSGADLEPSDGSPPDTELSPTAGSYDDAASKLELSLLRLEGNEYKAARFRLAETRFYAWRLDPGKERAVKAAGAIRAFLVGSSPGPDRERATRWLSEVAAAGY